MKKSTFLSTLALFALAACGSPTPSNDVLPPEMINEALANPNKMLLSTMMAMATTPNMATETNFETNGSFRQSTRETTSSSQSISTILFSFDVNAQLLTNDLFGSSPQAELVVNILDFRTLMATSFMGQSYTQDISFKDQSIYALYDEGMAYLDLSNANELLSSLSGGFLPTSKIKFPIQSPEELGLSPSEMTSEEQESFINEWLPFVDTIPGLEATIRGSSLDINYEITQAEFNQMVRDMVLEGTENLTLTSEDEAFLNTLIEDTIARVTIDTFSISLSLNLLTSQLTALLVDVDVEIADSYTYEMISDYDPDHPDADEEGWVWDEITIETLTIVDVFAQLSMESYSESRPIAVLINKDEFELVNA